MSLSLSRCRQVQLFQALPFSVNLTVKRLQITKSPQFITLVANKMKPQGTNRLAVHGVRCSCCTISQLVPVCDPCCHQALTLNLLQVARDVATAKCTWQALNQLGATFPQSSFCSLQMPVAVYALSVQQTTGHLCSTRDHPRGQGRRGMRGTNQHPK